MRRLAVVIALAACGDKQAPAPEPAPSDPPRVTHATTPVDPGNGMHLDDDVAKRPAPSGPPRQGKPIDVTLRSTPSGAQAAVDGIPVGTTPAYWNGMADGREHEFTFALAGYDIARYKFVPVTSGVIHARLVPVSEEVDAGVQAAALPPAPPPPPTVLSPPGDAAPVVPPPAIGPQP